METLEYPTLGNHLAAVVGSPIKPFRVDLSGIGQPQTWTQLTPSVSVRYTTGARAVTALGRLLSQGPSQAGAYPDTVEEMLTARPRYLLRGRDVLLAGQRALIGDGHLFNDVLLLPQPYFDHARALANFPHEFRPTPGVAREGESIVLDAGTIADRLIPVEEPVIALASTEARNYGSWLFRILPKLLLLNEYETPGEAPRALLLPQEAPWMVELASFFAPTRRIIPQDITRAYLLSDVLVPSLPAPANVFPDEVKAALQRVSRTHLGTGVGDKIYVSRRSWSAQVGRRVLENEAELVDALTRQGFREITPETLSLRNRIAAFADARLIVGPTGSALFNTVFASASARVLEIEPLPRWRAMHSALYRSLGLDHAFETGEVMGAGSAPDHPRWRIDSDAVLHALRLLER